MCEDQYTRNEDVCLIRDFSSKGDLVSLTLHCSIALSIQVLQEFFDLGGSNLFTLPNGRLCFSSFNAANGAKKRGATEFNCLLCKTSHPVDQQGPIIRSDSTLHNCLKGDFVPPDHVKMEVKSGATIKELKGKLKNTLPIEVIFIIIIND